MPKKKKPVRQQSLAQLTKAWYKKLAASGFNEIEDVRPGKDALMRWDAYYLRSVYTPDQYAAKETYFQMAEALLQTYNFKSAYQKNIWTLHAAGDSLREIAKKLHTHHSRVALEIAAIRKEMLPGYTTRKN